MNSTVIYGHIGQDPDIRKTTTGISVANLSVATSDRTKNQSGEWVDHTDWHNVVFYGTFADTIAKKFKKGDKILVEGKNKTESYVGKDGVKRYVTKIHGNRFSS